MVDPGIRGAGYAVRYRDRPELLVFERIGMPEAGTQIPQAMSAQVRLRRVRSYARPPRKPGSAGSACPSRSPATKTSG